MKTLLFVLLLILSEPFGADVTPLTFAVPPFSPFFYADVQEDNPCRGIGVDVLNMISKVSSIEFSFENYPYTRTT